MTMTVEQSVALEISLLSKKELTLSKYRLADLIANRITKGWSFKGVSVEKHNEEVKLIKAEVLRLTEVKI